MKQGVWGVKQPASMLWLICTLLMTCCMNLVQHGQAQQQLRLDDTIQVVSGPLNVRASPGVSGSIIGQVVQNQIASIADAAPHWADGYWWWSIRAADGIAGWVAEGDASEDYIGLLQAESSPVPASSVTAEQQPSVAADEAGTVAAQVSKLEGAATEVASSIEVAAGAPDPLEVKATDPAPLLDPYAHLPDPVRLEREQIDSELGGFWVSLAFYGAGPGRGGPAFSWGHASGSRESGSYYWCESGLLTAGAPFFQRIEHLGSSGVQFQKNSLSIADLEVSCAGSSGLRIAAAELNRALAFLRSSSPFPQHRSSTGQADLIIAESHSLLNGQLFWLEASRSSLEMNESEWLCLSGQANFIIASPGTQNPMRCERIHENAGMLEILLIDAEQGAVTWEFTFAD